MLSIIPTKATSAEYAKPNTVRVLTARFPMVLKSFLAHYHFSLISLSF